METPVTVLDKITVSCYNKCDGVKTVEKNNQISDLTKFRF
nr:MAG TPA: hypothetical protein [Caudoviricetes sp.]